MAQRAPTVFLFLASRPFFAHSSQPVWGLDIGTHFWCIHCAYLSHPGTISCKIRTHGNLVPTGRTNKHIHHLAQLPVLPPSGKGSDTPLSPHTLLRSKVLLSYTALGACSFYMCPLAVTCIRSLLLLFSLACCDGAAATPWAALRERPMWQETEREAGG